jgi:protein-L-isoaspartate(D-aspartate) O-methyltransferase
VHDLFCADSHGVLDHLRRPEPRLGRRTVSLLLCDSLLRAAGLDTYERDDVFDRVTQRTAPATRLPAAEPALRAAVLRLVTAQTYTAGSPLAVAPAWARAFEAAGLALAELAADGKLTRGVRAVLAHHILFAWNRAGIPAAAQARLADCAARAIFDRHDQKPASPARLASCPD